jgi:hypothetical protein
MTSKLPQPPLLLVTDRRQARRPLQTVVTAALSAGCRWVSLREKDLPADEQILLARSLLPIVHAQHGKLMLHGEASLARDAGVDGVHLPAGRDAAAARALMGSEKILGVSIHTVTASTMRSLGRRSRRQASLATGLRSVAKGWPTSHTPVAFPSWRSAVSTRPGLGKCSPVERRASRSWVG